LRILVLGGTSFFGAEIVDLLLDEDHEVAVLTRGKKQPDWLGEVQHLVGDRTDSDQLHELLAGEHFDILIDNIAYQARDVETILDVLGDRLGRYILTSTASVYRYVPRRTMPLEEDEVDFEWQPPEFDPQDRGWEYASGKRDAERVLLHQNDVPYTIIRPPIVLGPVDPTLRGYFYFQRLLDGKPVILTNGGINSFRMVYSGDLARAYLLAMDSKRAVNRVYNITQTEIITTRDFVAAAAEVLASEAEIVAVPERALQASELDYADPYARLINFIPAVRRAQIELGYESTPYQTWVKDTARWFRDHYQGQDAQGYSDREREVGLAKGFLA